MSSVAVKAEASRIKGSLMGQFGVLASGRFMAAAVSLLWFAIAARELSIDEFADLSLLLSVGGMSAVIADWGYAVVVNESVARSPASARSALVLALRRRLALTPIAIAVTAALYLTASNDRSVLVVLAFSASLVASVVYTTATAAMRGAGTVTPDAVNEVASRCGVLVIAAMLVHRGGGLLVVIVAYAAVDIVSATVLTRVAWGRLSGEVAVDRAAFSMQRLLPLGFASLVGLVYYRVDIWLLGLLGSAEDLARYAVCVRILDGLIIPAGVLAVLIVGSTASLPLNEARHKADRMAGMLVAALTPAIAILLVIPGPLLALGFGETYRSAAPILRITSLAIIPTILGMAWAPLASLRGLGIVRVTSISLVGNVALNILLIPHLGGSGAAVATVIGQIVFAALLRVNLRDRS